MKCEFDLGCLTHAGTGIYMIIMLLSVPEGSVISMKCLSNALWVTEFKSSLKGGGETTRRVLANLFCTITFF